MIKKLCFTAIFLAVFAAIPAGAQERFLRPVDEGPEDASFTAFRTKLRAAVEKRDAAFIYSILDPRIMLSFGGSQGLKDFKQNWKIENKRSDFWPAMKAVIENGGHFDRENAVRSNSFWAPYTFNGWPQDLDAFEYAAIFGKDVNVREAPGKTAKVVAQLSYNIVKAEYGEPRGDKISEWAKITTLGGITGYVHTDYIRSPIDLRANFEKKRGVWKMTTFIAGD